MTAEEREAKRREHLASEYGGWITPQGLFVPCLTLAQHDELCKRYTGRDSDFAIKDCGWLKISPPATVREWTLQGNGFLPPTQRQLDTLWDWAHEGHDQDRRKRAVRDYMLIFKGIEGQFVRDRILDEDQIAEKGWGSMTYDEKPVYFNRTAEERDNG